MGLRPNPGVPCPVQGEASTIDTPACWSVASRPREQQCSLGPDMRSTPIPSSKPTRGPFRKSSRERGPSSTSPLPPPQRGAGPEPQSPGIGARRGAHRDSRAVVGWPQERLPLRPAPGETEPAVWPGAGCWPRPRAESGPRTVPPAVWLWHSRDGAGGERARVRTRTPGAPLC